MKKPGGVAHNCRDTKIFLTFPLTNAICEDTHHYCRRESFPEVRSDKRRNTEQAGHERSGGNALLFLGGHHYFF